MLDQHDKQDITYLNEVNAELMRSLRRCHLFIEDCRAHITPANSNEAPFMLAGELAEGGERRD